MVSCRPIIGINMKIHDGLSNLTYFTTSFNGQKRLSITLEFLRATGFDGQFIIVDATSENQSLNYADYKFVTYKHRPKCSAVEGVAIAASMVETPYAAFIGDDDLPILSGVKKVLSFLESNQDFEAVSGRAGFIDFDKLFSFKRLNLFDRFRFAVMTFLSDRYDQSTNLEDHDPLTRMQALKQKYTVSQFFITRTEYLHHIYNDSFLTMSDVHASEYSFCYAHAALCRSKKLSHTYLLRGIGSHRPNADPQESRHRLENFDKLQVEIEDFFRKLKLSDACRNAAINATKEARHRAEQVRVSTSKRKMSTVSYLYHQIKRFHFVLTGQTRERIRLALWGCG